MQDLPPRRRITDRVDPRSGDVPVPVVGATAARGWPQLIVTTRTRTAGLRASRTSTAVTGRLLRAAHPASTDQQALVRSTTKRRRALDRLAEDVAGQVAQGGVVDRAQRDGCHPS